MGYWAVFTALYSLSIKWISSRIARLRQLRTNAIIANLSIISRDDPANIATLGGDIDKEIDRIRLLLEKKQGKEGFETHYVSAWGYGCDVRGGFGDESGLEAWRLVETTFGYCAQEGWPAVWRYWKSEPAWWW